MRHKGRKKYDKVCSYVRFFFFLVFSYFSLAVDRLYRRPHYTSALKRWLRGITTTGDETQGGKKIRRYVLMFFFFFLFIGFFLLFSLAIDRLWLSTDYGSTLAG